MRITFNQSNKLCLKQINSPEEFPKGFHYLLIVYRKIRVLVPDSSWEHKEEFKEIVQCEHWVTTDINSIISFIKTLDSTITYVVLQVQSKGQFTQAITFPTQVNIR
jgi:hypothetical protein